MKYHLIQYRYREVVLTSCHCKEQNSKLLFRSLLHQTVTYRLVEPMSESRP